MALLLVGPGRPGHWFPMWGRSFLLAGILATGVGAGRCRRRRVTADSVREAGIDTPACARMSACHRPADVQSGCGLRRIARCFPCSVNWPPTGRPTSLWWPRRPLATLGRKPRQGRKAATVSIDAGAEVSRRGHRLFCTGVRSLCMARGSGPGVAFFARHGPAPIWLGRAWSNTLRHSELRSTPCCSGPSK